MHWGSLIHLAATFLEVLSLSSLADLQPPEDCHCEGHHIPTHRPGLGREGSSSLSRNAQQMSHHVSSLPFSMSVSPKLQEEDGR